MFGRATKMASDREIVTCYLEALAARDYDTAASLLAPDAEIVSPEETVSGAVFLQSLREWEGLDNLDISVRDRVISEEDGTFVSRATRVFSWKESGEVAYEQPAEARLSVDAGTIIRVEVR